MALKRVPLVFGSAIILALLLSSGCYGADSRVSSRIRERIDQLWTTGELHIDGIAIASRDMLPDLYERNLFEPLWQNPINVRDLIAEISSSGEDGLSPEDYHLSTLLATRMRLDQENGAGAAALEGDCDILLTDSLILLCYHLLFGKVDPEDLDSDWNMGREVNSDSDPVGALLRRLRTETLSEGLKNIRPRYATYGKLKDALKRYRAIQEAGGWNAVPVGPTLKQGMTDARILALRERLTATGDCADPVPEEPSYFDESLEEAVRRFQARHQLGTDGAVGKKTLAELNVPVEQRIDQIRVNLERARWVFHKLPPEYLLVDIAGFQIYFCREDAVVWSSRIQVGKPYRHTPVFKSKLRYIVFNPGWVVPPTILKEDILPKLVRDPGYLEKMKIRVIGRDGTALDPDAIEWTRYRSGNVPFTLKQDPGPHNALGRMKFIFPNKHLVYLHDTASANLFEKEERAFSSGCIRVEKYLELAQILLGDPVHWGRDRIRTVIDSGETRQVPLPSKMPIILIYATVSVDQSGSVIFKKDIYDRDGAVLEGLNETFGIWQRRAFNR